MNREITERKQAQEEAQEAQRAAEQANQTKSSFVANMSHELRTPLTGILGYTQLFKQDQSFTEEQRFGIEVIHRSGEHLLRLIDEVLDFSKIEAHKLTLNPSAFALPNFYPMWLKWLGFLPFKKDSRCRLRLKTTYRPWSLLMNNGYGAGITQLAQQRRQVYGKGQRDAARGGKRRRAKGKRP